jgi:PAS domain S-box-containing protein
MVPDHSSSGKKDEVNDDRDRLILALKQLQDAYDRQAKIIARYERLYKNKKRPKKGVYGELEVQREVNESLKKELKETREDLEARNEELEAWNKELQLSLEQQAGIEAAAVRSERDFRAIVEKNADAMVVLDGEGRVLYVNPAGEALFGLSAAEMVGKSFGHPIVLDKPVQMLVLRHFKSFIHVEMRLVEVTWSGEPAYLISLRDMTDHIKAEEALSLAKGWVEDSLQVSEEKYRLRTAELQLLLESIPTPVWIAYDRDCGNMTGNRASYEILGLALEENPSATPRDGNPPSYRVRIDGRFVDPEDMPIQRAARTGRQTSGTEVEIIRGDGQTRWMYGNAIPLFDGQGEVRGAIGAFVDITERKQAEETLLKQAALIDLSPDAVMVRGLGGTVKFWAHGAETLYGFTKGEAVGKLSHELLQTRFPEPLEAIMRQVAENGSWTGELVHRAKDGREVIVESRWRGQRDGHGELLEILESNVDVTGRKRAEAAFIESEARRKAAEAVKAANEYNRSLIESSLDPLVTISPEGMITDVNAATENVTGYSRAELIGTDFSNYFTEPGKADEGYLKAFKEGSVTDYPLEIKHRDGHMTPVLYNASLYKDDAGNVVGVFAAARDITERKRAEMALQNMNLTLERLVVERTADLGLSKQQAELYLDLMGHDINNMHQIALGYLELARDMPPGREQANFLDKPMEVLQRSAQLISNVRKLQKLRDGVFQTRDVDVGRVLTDIQREYGAMPNKRIILNVNGCGGCTVRANELLHDVFANLVGNAIKHTGDHADVTVNMDIVKEADRRYCRVMVEDDGPGIPDDSKAAIFNRTIKGTGKAKGMGLGLYLVKSLVDSYGGRVWVEDRVKGDHTKGARFVVMLPQV